MFVFLNGIFLILYATISFGMNIEIDTLKKEARASHWASELFLIIDMQPGFVAAENPALQDRIIAELEVAMQKNQLVIFIEYREGTPTLPAITQVAENYPLKFTLYKAKNSGYQEIADFLNHFGDDKYVFNVCGIETAACVYETVMDLCASDNNYRVNVLIDCCGSAIEEQHDETITLLRSQQDDFANLAIQGETKKDLPTVRDEKAKSSRTWKIWKWKIFK